MGDGPRISPTASNTTYHSFNDIELQEPPSPPRTRDSTRRYDCDANSPLDPEKTDHNLTAVKMQRKDSGYGSNTASPRTSSSRSRPPTSPTRRTSNPGPQPQSPSSPPLRSRARPSTRRAAKSYPQPSAQPLFQARVPAAGTSRPQQQQIAFFHFPTPDLVELTEAGATSSSASSTHRHNHHLRHQEHSHLHHIEHEEDRATSSGPPQTTHYWTSDSTRRLEYAAIDAASRGFTGWVRRHLVPDCFNPRQHVAFDDDTGSVRRYRLELEDEDEENDHCGGGSGAEKTHHGMNGHRRRKGWTLWPLRKRNTI
ncbi:hypothetical protein JDV02_008715 [Purpureocillium takamizusanense]|uniref:Uncharacterized protein n=1 Tax=Purpureocillium takamizusanense TaxID=2060973 RepID=A0A9Q8QKR5_9HYPO|nr:uncharacterized protein JDV02_008715 [Purpureocillium takamizusanense]UNI22869.1 hypothetical protein JDV02_008715 [Purpureocillium takamizusanense]